MIIVPKDQATLSFLLETKELKDEKTVSISPLTPKDRKFRMVLLGQGDIGAKCYKETLCLCLELGLLSGRNQP